MSDADSTSGAEFTPSETAYFESGGQKPVDAPAQDGGQTPQDGATEQSPDPAAPDKQQQKFVPHAALHEERERRKHVEAKARETELENARYQERFRILEQWNKSQQQTPAPAEANFDEDFISAGKQTAEQVKGVEAKLKEFEAVQTRQQQQQFVYNLYSQDAERQRAETPDFNDAYKFVIDRRKAEYAALGYEGQEAAYLLRNDEESVILSEIRRNRKPAAAMYAIAKAMGYQPKAKSNEVGEKLDAIERGQAANKSLSSAGGEGGADNMTAERALKMPLDEFEVWSKKHPAQAKKLMGG